MVENVIAYSQSATTPVVDLSVPFQRDHSMDSTLPMIHAVMLVPGGMVTLLLVTSMTTELGYWWSAGLQTRLCTGSSTKLETRLELTAASALVYHAKESYSNSAVHISLSGFLQVCQPRLSIAFSSVAVQCCVFAW